jgi:beta-lactamase regulating signal transducer with metallopeptidase domain
MTAMAGLVTLWLPERLLSGALQAVVLVPVAWLVTRATWRLPASVHAWAWWMVALRLLLVFAPLPALPVAVLPPPPVTPPVVAVDNAVPTGAGHAEGLPSEPAASVRTSAWRSIAIGVWLAVVLVHAGRLLAAYRRVRRLISRSMPVEAADIEPLARQCGLSFVPAVRSSPDVDAPQVIGVRHPIVVVPETLTAGDRRMALAHEFMHVRRRDVACGWIPALAERLFFFHPLVRVAAREYVTAREAACDAAVVCVLAIEPAEYGRLLIRFGVTRSRAAFAAGGASASASSLRRRLNMLQHSSIPGSRGFVIAVCAIIALAFVPIRLVAQADPAPPAASALPADPAPAAAPAAQAAPSPAPQPKPAVPVAPPARPRRAQVAAPPRPPSEETVEFLKQRLAEAERALREAQEQQNVAAKQADVEAARQRDLAKEREMRAQVQELERRQALIEKAKQQELDDRGAQITKELEVLQKQMEQLSDRMRELERALRLQNGSR